MKGSENSVSMLWSEDIKGWKNGMKTALNIHNVICWLIRKSKSGVS